MSGFTWTGLYSDTPGDVDPEGWALEVMAAHRMSRRDRRRWERAAIRAAGSRPKSPSSCR